MTPQDQTTSGGGVGGGFGRSSKKPKLQKKQKIPKRGIGVAALERKRMEEQQQRRQAAASAILPKSPPPSSLSPTQSYSYLPLQLPSFHHSNASSSAILLHPVRDFLVLPASPQILDVPLENSGNVDSTLPSLNLPFESNNHNWPSSSSSSIQTTQQYQQQPSSSSMVNVSSGNLTSPGYYYSKEPPSNQNYSSSYMPMRPEQKMTLLKRSYPFSLNIPPMTSSLNFKSPAFTATNVRANESTSRGFGTCLNLVAASSAFREVPSCSTPSSEPKSKKNNENSNGHFLSLALPAPTFPASHNQELPHVEPTPFQGSEGGQIPHGQQQCLHSFLPEKEAETTVHTTETNNKDGNCNGEIGGSVDLNLKL